MKNLLDKIYDFGVKRTDLFYSNVLSQRTGANVFIKREDLQDNKSFKIRGAMNNIINQLEISKEKNENLNDKVFICASTGNHAQGVAMACFKIKQKGIVFMPKNASYVKIDKTKHFGGDFVEVKLVGDNFDECLLEAEKYTKEHNDCFIHPYDDNFTIEGQSSLMNEVYSQLKEQNKNCDLVFSPVGGGGLVSGIIKSCKEHKTNTKIIGCQTELCHPLTESLKNNKNTESNIVKKEVITDGSLVKKIGNLTWDIINNAYKNKTFDIEVLDNNKVLYCMGLAKVEHNIDVEGAGGLSFAGFLQYAQNNNVENKNVVLVNSGGNVSVEMQKKAIDYYSNSFC